MTLQKWMRRAEVDEGAKPGQTRTEAAEIRERQDDGLGLFVGVHKDGRATVFCSCDGVLLARRCSARAPK